MAYREFYKRQEVTTPDYSGITEGISNLFQGLADTYLQRKKASDQYKYALEYGKFENDNKFNEEYVKNVVALGKENFRKQGAASPELVQKEEQGKRFVADQKAQWERFTKLDTRIKERAVEDPYYDPEVDKKNVEVAVFGEDGDVDFRTRGQRLDQVAKSVGSDPRAFKYRNYVADWVKGFGQKEKKTKSGSETFERSYEYKSPFIDPKTGKPGVTEDHAKEFIDSRPDVLARIQMDIDKDLIEDVSAIKQLRNKKDSRVDWAKDMSDEDILLQIKGKAELNPFATKDSKGRTIQYNERIIEKARKDLKDAATIAESVSVDFKKPASSDGAVKNDNIGHSTTFFNTKSGVEGVSDKAAGAFGLGAVSGPGGLLMIKKGVSAGRPITIEADSKNAFNYRSGKNFKREGRGKFNLTGYQLQPYSKDGKLFTIGGNDLNEFKQNIEKLTPEQLRNMEPELQLSLQGYTIDDSKMLGDISTKSYQLNEQLGQAIDDNDLEKQATLRQQIDQLAQMRNSFNLADVYDEDIINAAAKSGIKSTRVDQLLKADKSDLDKIKTITEGLDLTDRNNWSLEMTEVNELYKSKWQAANKEEPKPAKKTEAKKYPLPAGKPRVVKQNGVEYVWSEESGQYE